MAKTCNAITEDRQALAPDEPALFTCSLPVHKDSAHVTEDGFIWSEDIEGIAGTLDEVAAEPE